MTTEVAYINCEECIICGYCVDECPGGSMVITDDISKQPCDDGYAVNPDACIAQACGNHPCTEVCPVECIEMVNR